MKELTLEQANLTIKYHAVDHDPKAQEFKRWVLANHYKYTNTEIIATMLENYIEKRHDDSFIKLLKDMGVSITKKLDCEHRYTISLGKESYEFIDLTAVIDEDLLIPGKCHECCFNAALRFNEDGECNVCTAKVSAINNKTNFSLSKLLHSYLEVGEYVFDLSSKIGLKIDDYIKLFNVEILSRLPASVIQEDVQNKNIDLLAKVKYPMVAYLLARTEAIADAKTTLEIRSYLKE